MASRDKGFGFTLLRLAYFCKKCRVNIGMSSRRSRSGGIVSFTTASR